MDIWEKLKRSDRPIVIYGMGDGAQKIVNVLHSYGKEADGFFASDGFVRGQFFLGKKVMTFHEAKELYPDMRVLVGFGSNLKEVTDRIKSLDAETYAPDVPVVGDTLFNCGFYKEHKEELDTVRAHLADSLSVKTFDEICAFKLDGEIRHLTACECEEKDITDILKLSDNEKYLDLGAYNGDTVLKFVSQVTSWQKITAIEADARNFRKLKANTENLKNTVCLNGAVSDREGETVFFSKGGRNGRISENGKTVQSFTVDGLNEDFTFIKADVEGAEEKMLTGGENTVKRCHPKMMISAYHRSEDIFSLPLKVLKIDPTYRIYMRHRHYIPAWDTDFIFI